MKINKPQNARLHLLLNKTNLTPQKADLVLAFTEGRTDSSREMSVVEADELITYLNSLDNTIDPADKMRKKVLSMCHRLNWVVESGVDMTRLNNWCLASSYLKKELNKYTYQELPKLVTQFRTVYLHYIKSTTK